MRHALYDELVPFYRLLDPTEGHEDEVASFVATFERALGPSETRRSLLELGAGAGNNVFYARDRFDCTLVDLSEPMLSLSRALNPACEHVVGDLRTVRLGRAFDAVLVHDAICYMLTEEDLAAAARTAYAHTCEQAARRCSSPIACASRSSRAPMTTLRTRSTGRAAFA